MILIMIIISIIMIFFDYIMEKFKIEGRYYINHCIVNGLVVYNTIIGSIYSYDIMKIPDMNTLESINITKDLIYSLHLYHIIWYYKKLRFDDWMHHILMVGVALPLTECIPSSNITLHSFFFINGLPGCIDYFLLFLNRNNIVSIIFEKKVNNFLNLWIRCPGCIMNITLIISNIVFYYDTLPLYSIIAMCIIICTIYWNGIYFMNQVVIDYNIVTLKKIEK